MFPHQPNKGQVRRIDYTSPVTKINVALNKLPNFLADPNSSVDGSEPEPHHRATIHINCEESRGIDEAFEDAAVFGKPSKKPLIELVIPSSLDPTIAPKGMGNPGTRFRKVRFRKTKMKIKNLKQKTLFN